MIEKLWPAPTLSLVRVAFSRLNVKLADLFAIKNGRIEKKIAEETQHDLHSHNGIHSHDQVASQLTFSAVLLVMRSIKILCGSSLHSSILNLTLCESQTHSEDCNSCTPVNSHRSYASLHTCLYVSGA